LERPEVADRSRIGQHRQRAGDEIPPFGDRLFLRVLVEVNAASARTKVSPAEHIADGTKNNSKQSG
jgi:hypothetical protein